MTPDLFIRVSDGKLILWNYVSHEQFELDLAHLRALVAMSQGKQPTCEAAARAIHESGCLRSAESPTWTWDCLSRIFHLGTQIRLAPGEELPQDDHGEGYLAYCNSIANDAPRLTTELPGAICRLPEPDWSSTRKVSLADALSRRKTCREFLDRATTVQELATALWLTFGAIHGPNDEEYEAAGFETLGFRRTSPSGGSLQPSEPYVLAMRVEGLEPALYHYRSHSHVLSKLPSNIEREKLGGLLCGQYCATELAYGIFITSRFDKLWWKYPHSRAYRVALIDIGCLAQTFQLVCTAQGLQSWLTGYFLDCEINRILGVDVERESVMFFLGAGHGSGAIGWGARNLAARQRSLE